MPTCSICYTITTNLHTHEKECKVIQLQLLDKYNNTKSIPLTLTKNQRYAIKNFRKKAKIYSRNIMHNLSEKFTKMGYSPKELNNTIIYIKNAPLVIHVNLRKTLEYLVNDTHYRNLFETSTSGGSTSQTARKQWENQMFGTAYDESTAEEKVKYGAINITNNLQGVSCAKKYYGLSYLVLKDDVKLRTSFTFGDSSKKEMHICTFQHLNHILYYINDPLLIHLVDLANGRANNSTMLYSPFIEFQVHGPLRLNGDVKTLMVDPCNKKNNNILNNLNKFQQKHNIPYMWINKH